MAAERTEQEYLDFVKEVKTLRWTQDEWRRYRVYGTRCKMIALEKKIDEWIKKLMPDEQADS